MEQNRQNSVSLVHELREKLYVLQVVEYYPGEKDPRTMNTFFKYDSSNQEFNPDQVLNKAYQHGLARAKALGVELVLEDELAQRAKKRES